MPGDNDAVGQSKDRLDRLEALGVADRNSDAKEGINPRPGAVRISYELALGRPTRRNLPWVSVRAETSVQVARSTPRICTPARGLSEPLRRTMPTIGFVGPATCSNVAPTRGGAGGRRTSLIADRLGHRRRFAGSGDVLAIA